VPAADAGAVTAEVAIALPTVVVVLVACLAGVGMAMTQHRAHDAAATSTRLLARGESMSRAVDQVERVMPGAMLTAERSGDLICSQVSTGAPLLGRLLPISSRACALGDNH
jgi:Flp pilus assembly protein TadG